MKSYDTEMINQISEGSMKSMQSSEVESDGSNLTDRLLAGAEGFTENSSYFDIFDNLLAKRVTDLNLRN